MPSNRLDLSEYPRSYADAARILGRRESRIIGPAVRVQWSMETGHLSVQQDGYEVVTWPIPGPRRGGYVYLRNNGRWTRRTLNLLNACIAEGWTITPLAESDAGFTDVQWLSPQGGWRIHRVGQSVGAGAEFYDGLYLTLPAPAAVA